MNLNKATRGVSTVLASDVAPTGTFTVGYPSDTPRSWFVGTGNDGFVFVAGTFYPVSGGKVSLSFGASSVTVTWNGDRTLKAGEEVIVGLPINLEHKNLMAVERRRPEGANALYLVRYSLAIPSAADTDAIAASQTRATAGDLNLTASEVVLDYARTVTITSSGDLSGVSFTVYGYDIAGRKIASKVTGPNTTTVSTPATFKKVTRVAVSGGMGGVSGSVGFGDTFGLPCFLPYAAFGELGLVNGSADTITWVAGASGTISDTSSDAQGKATPNTVPNGSRNYELVFYTSDINALGTAYEVD